MRRSPFAAALLCIALACAAVPALGHAPSRDNQHACLHEGTPVVGAFRAPSRVEGTMSYLAPLGSSQPCGAFATAEWGSHARICHDAPQTYATQGAYCGPVVPPMGTATCTWSPVETSVPTGLVIGFDGVSGVLPVFNGFIQSSKGEGPVYGPFPGGSWRVANPYSLPGRVVAYPTNTALPPDAAAGVLAVADVSNVVCAIP